MTALEAYRVEREKADAAIKNAQEACKSAFLEGVREVIASDEQVTEIAWTQYTPYFNDGDACVFGVNKPEVNGKNAWSWKYDDDKAAAPSEATWERVGAFFKNFPEEDMKFIFGDHVRVVATAAGVDVEEYEHD